MGDNIFQTSLINSLKSYTSGAHLFLKEVHDPKRFGVAEIKDKKIQSIIEKPSKPKSNYAVTGIYIYDHQVFDIIRQCHPSARGELEISDVNAHYLLKEQVNYSIMDGWWSDAGTFESLAKASELINTKPS